MPKAPLLVFHVHARNLTIFTLAISLLITTACSAGSAKQCKSGGGKVSAAKSSTFYAAQIEMHGVGCVGCIRRIERNLRQTKGVEHAEVNQVNGAVIADVKYDSSAVKLDDLLKQIKIETEEFKVKKNQRVR